MNGWNIELSRINFLLKQGGGVLYDICFSKTVQFIEQNIASKECIFTFNDLRALLVPNFHQFSQRYGRSTFHWNINILDIFWTSSQFSRVSYPNPITLATFYGLA